MDPCVNSSISGMLDGSIFEIVDEYNVNCAFGVQESETDLYYNDNYLKVDHENYIYTGSDPTKKARKCVYVAPNTNIKVIDNYEFSNIAGNAAEVNRFKYTTESYYKDLHYGVPIYNIKSENENNDLNIVRGKFTPYVGIAANDIAEGKIYSIRLDESNTNLSNLFLVRKQDSSEYYCVSERNPIRNGENEIYNSDVYRGDYQNEYLPQIRSKSNKRRKTIFLKEVHFFKILDECLIHSPAYVFEVCVKDPIYGFHKKLTSAYVKDFKLIATRNEKFAYTFISGKDKHETKRK